MQRDLIFRTGKKRGGDSGSGDVCVRDQSAGLERRRGDSSTKSIIVGDYEATLSHCYDHECGCQRCIGFELWLKTKINPEK